MQLQEIRMFEAKTEGREGLDFSSGPREEDIEYRLMIVCL